MGVEGVDAALPTGPDSAALLASLSVRGAAARLYANGTGQSSPNSTLAQVVISSLAYESDADVFDADASNSQITVLVPGTYLVSWAVKFAGGSSGVRQAFVWVNGFTRLEASTGAATSVTVGRAEPLRLAAGDVLTLVSNVDGGAPVPISSAASYETGLTLVYLGG